MSIYHEPGERPSVIWCGGRSPKTGKKVGQRHRWEDRTWGKGYCEFCGRTIEQVMTKLRPEWAKKDPA